MKLSFNLKTKLNSVFAKFGKEELFKFGKTTLSTGEAITFDGDALVVGVEVRVYTDAGEMPIADGIYETTEGIKFKVEGGLGLVTEIAEAVATEDGTTTPPPANPAMEEAPSTPATDPMAQAKEEVKRTIIEEVKKFADEYQAKFEAQDALIKSQGEMIVAMSEMVVAIAETPSEKPTVPAVESRFKVEKPISSIDIHGLANNLRKVNQ